MRRNHIVLVIALVLFIALCISLWLYQKQDTNAIKLSENEFQNILTEISRKQSKEEVASILRGYGFAIDDSCTVEEMILLAYAQMGYDLEVFTYGR